MDYLYPLRENYRDLQWDKRLSYNALSWDNQNERDVSVTGIIERLKTYLDQPRYLHSIGVQTTAIALAKRYEVSIDHAQTAGLLHDCARCFPLSKMEKIWKDHPGYLDSEEEQISALWHAPVSALVAESDFQITDSETLTAIRFHPTGRPEMTSLDKIIFVADFIEPNRSFENINQYRDKAFDGLNQITLSILAAKLEYLNKQGLKIHSRGIAAYEYVKKDKT